MDRAWPIGILGVVQTPFTAADEIDRWSLLRLIEDVLDARIDGLLVPAVASENAYLTLAEKLELAATVQAAVSGAVPVFWGAGAHDEETAVHVGQRAQQAGAAGLLVAVPPSLYEDQAQIVPYFVRIARQVDLPLMVQDLQFGGPGMEIEVIARLCTEVDAVRYLKIETVPAGPKYTAVLAATGGRVHVSGGWAVQQMAEALDRGVHAMIPECSMVRIYKAIDARHRGGQREAARELFRSLAPILGFTNQQLEVSIRFFKRLLVRKGIFRSPRCRLPTPDFDVYQERVANELIDDVLALEAALFLSSAQRSE
ncbi:MAG: dihydrodipicolinate synthase family protein [Caldilineaceae bacterium]|nr:dihydrodipicolinate synthase family protein [Caldilineaceae bacterium]